MNLKDIDYRGLVAVIIATSLGLAIVVSVAGLAWRNRVLGEAGSEAIIAIGSALVGALAGYMGGRYSQNSKDKIGPKPGQDEQDMM